MRHATLRSSIVSIIAFGVGLSGLALGASAEQMLAADQVVPEINKYCINTDAQAAKAEKVLRGLNLPSDQVRLEQFDNVQSFHIDLSDNHRLQADLIAGGDVRNCYVHIYLEDADAAFAALKSQFKLPGKFEDYEGGKADEFKATTPSGRIVTVTLDLDKLKDAAQGTASVHVQVE
jgi:hypothetical protein